MAHIVYMIDDPPFLTLDPSYHREPFIGGFKTESKPAENIAQETKRRA